MGRVLLTVAGLLGISLTLAAQSGDSLEERFKKADKNGDGKVTREELPLPRLFDQLDKNGDGFITLPEARAVLGKLALPKTAEKKPGEVKPTSEAREQPVRQGPRLLAPGEQGVGRQIPDLEATDIDGKKVRLSDFKKSKALVIAFTSTSCPLCLRYAPSLGRLEKTWKEEGVAFLYVDPIASDIPVDMKKAIQTHGFQGPYVHDQEGKLSQSLGAKTTTEVFVLDAARTLIYRGAVDDQYGLGYSLDAPRQSYLVEALKGTLKGKPLTVAATDAPGCALEFEKASTVSAAITYHNRISRLVQNHCLECHHQGGVAPFSLEKYEDVVAHKGMIRKVVDRGTMPPWFAAAPSKDIPHLWANDRSLAAVDKADLLAWLQNGHPAGDAADAPLPRTFHEGWQIGKPDLIVQIPKPISIKAEGVMAYQNATAVTDLAEDQWVQALEVQPTARAVVHHVLVFVQAPGKRGGVLFPSVGDGADDERGGFFALYVPGTSTLVYPSGFAKKLPKGSSLRFQIHYTPNGTATTDQVRLGMVFAKEPPRHEVKVIGLVNPRLRIPPEADNHPENAGLRLPVDAQILGFLPHMHLRGKAFRYEATLPDGKTQVLLDVPRYDFNWQLHYQLAEPMFLPRGTNLKATGWYDNSKNNPANPDPTRTVRWGPQTFEEMMLGYVEYYLPGQ